MNIGRRRCEDYDPAKSGAVIISTVKVMLLSFINSSVLRWKGLKIRKAVTGSGVQGLYYLESSSPLQRDESDGESLVDILIWKQAVCPDMLVNYIL